MPTLSFLDLNIECHRHLDRIPSFLKASQADVMCFQEIFEDTFEQFKNELGMVGAFCHRASKRSEPGREGMVILSKYPIKSVKDITYDNFTDLNEALSRSHAKRPLAKVLICEIEKEGQTFVIATTHFTWTPDGEASDEQRTNVVSLLEVLREYPALLLTGDFNAPRGKEIFDSITKEFVDTIPTDVKTTIDGEFHRAGLLELVVDGLFTRSYQVSNVQIHSGLSDHCGVTALISA